MKIDVNKAAFLIDALANNGSILYKEYEEGEKEFLFKAGNYYDIRGWGTAFGTVQDRLVDVVFNPNNWKVFPNFDMNKDEYPYPWSVRWKDKENVKNE